MLVRRGARTGGITVTPYLFQHSAKRLTVVASARSVAFGANSVFRSGAPRSMKMMGWTAPALRHQGAITWSSLNATTRGAIHHAGYHDRAGYRQESLSGPRR